MPTWIRALAVVFCAACGGTTGESVQPCSKVGQQCRLSKGGLGVCVRSVADQSRFDCTAQH